MRMILARIPQLLVCTSALVALSVPLSASAAHRVPSPGVPASASEVVLALDPAQSTIHWTLGTTLHTVHGTFALKRGTLRLDTEAGKASGEIVADATSGQSGNESRDKKMHKEILETPRYADVIFRPDRVDGKVPAEGSATVQIHGTFVLHGAEHELTVPVQAELGADHWKGTAKFRIPFIDWGLRNPSNFFLRTDKVVDIDLELAGAVQRSAATSQ
jgi:polyisoprenoid-binding protein YceI